MLICSNCFSDPEVIGFIQSSGTGGHCDICESDSEFTLELVELLDYFEELLSNFRKNISGTPLNSLIQDKWKFFSSKDNSEKILNEVLNQIDSSFKSAIDLASYSDEIVNNYTYWDSLKENLKWKRRFLPDIETIVELGWDGFFNTQFELRPDVTFYRARVHHESGMNAYSKNKMMCPEPRISKGGRANPSGIPYLYLSDNLDTVLYEVRSSYLDELSVGEFRLKKKIGKIKIVDFTEKSSLFQPSLVNETIKARLLKDSISTELSKPMRRYDTEIEYIPTQFICEFIKVYTGAGGVRFTSSLHPVGNNIVIFNDSNMRCVNVSVRKVNSLALTSIKI